MAAPAADDREVRSQHDWHQPASRRDEPSGGSLLPGATYDEYVDRGESENRNKELKCGLKTDRLSDHRYMANLFRLFLHVQAHNLPVRIRREIAAPPTELLRDDVDPDLPIEAVPNEALSGHARKQFANLRRRTDPLGEGHPATWRTRLIKVAAEVVERSRCIRVKLSSTWPYLHHFASISTAAVAFALAHPQHE
jgi:hypothetical protein